MDKRGIELIEKDLLPEAVHDRCFCEAGSREFVEFVSARVESMGKQSEWTEYYKARMIVHFSGEPRVFELVIKLLSNNETENPDYDKFLNEEMFYSKMTRKYKLNIFPKCYVADMGRYGRPIVVLEDLEASSFLPVQSLMDDVQLELALDAVKNFHDAGFELASNDFRSFREFYAKFVKIKSNDSDRSSNRIETIHRLEKIITKIRDEEKNNGIVEKEKDTLTICHGNLAAPGRFFFRYEKEKPVEVKIIGWNRMEYSAVIADLADILHDRISDDQRVEKYLRSYYSKTVKNN